MVKALIEKYAVQNGLPPSIVYGICMQESGLNFDAARYEPNYKWVLKDTSLKPKTCSVSTELFFQKTSWGLMQVMGGVLREYGMDGWINAIVKFPDRQIAYGCFHLRKKVQRYGLDLGILSYNSGSPILGKDNKPVNAEYLKNVMNYAKGWIVFQ